MFAHLERVRQMKGGDAREEWGEGQDDHDPEQLGPSADDRCPCCARIDYQPMGDSYRCCLACGEDWRDSQSKASEF
jgi:hypothetical protein